MNRAEDERAKGPESIRLLDGSVGVRALLEEPEVRKHAGPPEAWPRGLVAALGICLDAPHPMWLFWGRGAILFYNDAAGELLSEATPRAFGVPAAESKTELWELSEPSVAAVRSNGRPRRLVDQLFLTNDGGTEERYFDVVMSPVLDAGEIAGVLCSATETTRRVRAARRSAMLADLAARMAAAANEQAAWAAAVAALERNPADLPYAALYAADDDVATLAGTIGLSPRSARVPTRLDVLAPDSPWPLADVRRTNEPVRVQDALACALAAPDRTPCGYFVAGLNPRQPLDDDYRTFVVGTAERLAAGVWAARSREEHARREASLERRRRQLEQRCAELMRLYEHAPIPILVVRGANYIVERVNAAVLATSDDRELLGKPLFEAVPELAGQGFDLRLRNVLESGVPDVGREAVVRLERGGRMEDRYFTFISSPLLYGANAEPRVIIVANDVTEQVRSRAALEASEASYRNIFDGVDVSIWVQDISDALPMLDGLAAAGVDDLRGYFERHPEFLRRALDHVRIVDVNDATLRMFGARDKDELTRSIRNIFVAETWQAFGEMLIAANENGSVVRTDAVASTLGGDRRELMVTIAPIVDGPRAHRVLVTITDITDRKRMEEALREADRQKDEFLATLAHELRNPLAPLRSSVDLLRTVPGQTPAAVLGIVERQVEYLVRLAHDLFESSRIRRSTYDLRREHLPLGEVLRDAMETSRSAIDVAGHELDVRVPDEPLWIDGDRMRLGQIFGNLLNNAARYTREPGRIVVQAERTNEHVEVRVSDTGIGIPAEAMPKLFMMFGRLGGTDESDTGGLGIGLALAKQLVEMHGGTIEAQSEGAGKGSTFVVRLPLAADTQRAPPRPAPATQSIEGRRLLIVEDDRDTAESLKMILEANGAHVRVAATGPKALATFASFEPDGVLLDIGLPGMDGYEVARRLRAEFPSRSVQMVALTGWGREEDIERARNAGFDDHLVKPVDIAALRRLLSRPLDPPPESDDSRASMRTTG